MVRRFKRRDKTPAGYSWFSYPAEPTVERPWNLPSWQPPESDPVNDDVSVVKLMPEYSAELPLWYCEWWELSLPAQLLDRLADWQAAFDQGFDPGGGWRDLDARAKWSREADDLVVELQRRLPEGTRLEVDLWPLDGG